MPSPFPGMDPYLEHPGRWPDVHHQLISTIRKTLVERLRPRYFVTIEERVYISDEEDAGRSVIIPDLRVTKRATRPSFATGGGATAIAEPLELELLDEEVREARLEVFDSEYRQLTAVIEIVSPTNKVWGATGRGSYVHKRKDVSASSAHFLEIDLLRAGTPFYAKEALPPHDYLVHLSRAAEPRRRHQFWPIALEERLPIVAVPLRHGDPDVPLDLQAVLNASYAEAGYDMILNYSRDPIPPLSTEQNVWARSLTGAATTTGNG